MRLRHIPEADSAILSHKLSIVHPEEHLGKWSSLFRENKPIRLEIGMGKGRFLTDMAKKFPEYNYLGMELYSSVMYRALQRIDAMEDAPDNVLFICTDARNLTDIFSPGEIEGIYLNFSDPWPKDRHAKRRLTSPQFQRLYEAILAPGHGIEFKTDNRGLFDYSVEVFKENPSFEITTISYDLHRDAELMKDNVMTEYEEKFSSMGNPIYKLAVIKK